MNSPNPIAPQRLANQGLAGPPRRTAADVVSWLGAVQAQEFVPSQWALALRLRPGVTLAQTLRAHDEGRILRTHVLRPTWHFVTPLDIRWMLELSAPQVHRTMTTYNRQLGLDTRIMTRAAKVFERALEGGTFLTRVELSEHLRRAKIDATTTRLAHIAMWAELEGVIVSGPRRGAHHTYALLEERAPAAPRMPRDEALGELAKRYFRSHGPATIQDFMWWSGLKAADARRALEIAKPRKLVAHGRDYWTLGRARKVTDGARVHLLPIYDEYTVAYRRRDAVPPGAAILRTAAGNFVAFQHAVVIDGRITGTWRMAKRKGGVTVDIVPVSTITRTDRRELEQAAQRFGRFLGQAVTLRMAP